jgi:hypothetical protein
MPSSIASQEEWHDGASAQARCDGREVQFLSEPDEAAGEWSTTMKSDYQRAESYGVNANFKKGGRTSIMGTGGDEDELRFHGESTYKAAYKSHGSAKREPFLPAQTILHNEPTDYTTTSQSAFVALAIEPKKSFRPVPNGITYADDDVKFVGSTTSRDAFKLHPEHRPAESCEPKRGIMAPRPFEGSSTSHDAFVPFPNQPRPVMMKAPVAQPSALPFEGQSTSHSDFKLLTVPQGPAELGLQVVGGKFHPMLKLGCQAKKQGTARVTTVIPDQQKVEVVCVGKAPGKKNIVLGKFVLDGFPAKSQPHQAHVLVTFELLNQNKLQIRALDERSQRSKASNVRLR